MNSGSLVLWVGLSVLVVIGALMRGAQPKDLLAGVVGVLLLGLATVVLGQLIGLDALLSLLVGLAISLAAFIVIRNLRRPRTPGKSPYDFS